MEDFVAKILLVDDAESCRIQIKQVLENHEVIEAVDGLDALEKLESVKGIDLILCDINMPNMNGFIFCQKKNLIKDYKDIPTVMITTESNEEIKKEIKKYGVKGWILKPVDKKSLESGILHILEQNKKKLVS
jgi:two-component system chemotaxis response regulator CheY